MTQPEQSNPLDQQTSVQNKAPAHSEAQILIVDSNPAMSRILSRLLKKADLSFAVAGSGEEAVSMCKESSFKLILMEVNMPGMGGLEASQQIRVLKGDYNTIPIVAISAKMTDADIEKYRASGLNGQLKKPVNEVNLMATLKSFVNIPEQIAAFRPPEDDEIYAILDEDEMSLINWDTLKEYSSILKDEYQTMMGDFLKASTDLIGDMGEALIDKDGAEVRRLAHQLKSTSLIFGAEGVSNAAAQLEILGKENELEHANQYYKELHMSFERVQPVLRKKLTLMQSMH